MSKQCFKILFTKSKKAFGSWFFQLPYRGVTFYAAGEENDLQLYYVNITKNRMHVAL